MSGNNLLLDTNIIIYALKGLASVRPYFANAPFISVITEMEIIGVKDVSEKEMKAREAAVEFCSIIPFSNKIKERTIAFIKALKNSIARCYYCRYMFRRRYNTCNGRQRF